MLNSQLSDRAVIRLSPTGSGENVRGFLQGLVTQDTAAPMPLWAALLSPQGKALFDFFLWDDGDDVLIDAEAEHAEALIRRLSMYRLRRKIAIGLDTNLGVHWALDDAPDTAAIDPRHPDLGHRWIAPFATDAVDATIAYRTHRLSLGITEGVAEFGSDQTLWLECNAAELNGVSFSKGCYVGQENTARMNWRQKINRRMVVVPIAMADAKRQRIAYPDMALSVEHRRVEDLADIVLPAWLRSALAAPEQT